MDRRDRLRAFVSIRKDASVIPRPAVRSVPVSRRPAFEGLLCKAIYEQRLVELRYVGDAAARLFQPEAVFYTEEMSVNVAGVQILDPNNAGSDNATHTFNIGNIVALRISEAKFARPICFDQTASKLAGRLIFAA